MSDYDDSDEMACLEVMIDRSPSPTRNSANPSWESRYGELLKWRAEKGDTRVPKAEGALGRWVARQRELKRTGKLASDREEKLDDINFVWNTVTAMWKERFQRLGLWKKMHGHCSVPIAQGELGTWVSKQRQLRKRGKLTKEKVNALNSLNFTWCRAEEDWEDKFNRLVIWTRDHGHASVPFNEGELGWWVNTQRQCKRKGKLSVSREVRLKTLGFVWNPSNSRTRQGNVIGFGSSADTTPETTPGKIEYFQASGSSTTPIVHMPQQHTEHCIALPLAKEADCGFASDMAMMERGISDVLQANMDIVAYSMDCEASSHVQSGAIRPGNSCLVEPNAEPLLIPQPLWPPTDLTSAFAYNGAFDDLGMVPGGRAPAGRDDCEVTITELSGGMQSETDVLGDLLARNQSCVPGIGKVGQNTDCVLDDASGTPILVCDESDF